MKQILAIVFAVVVLTACNSHNRKNETSVVSPPDTIETVLHVEGMTCNHCEMAIQGSVAELTGIVSVKANHLDSTTIVKYDASQVGLDAIDQAIAKKGYKVTGVIR